MLTVENFKNNKNQFIITDTKKGIIVFQSYKTEIAVVDLQIGILTVATNAYDFSKTTSKYLNLFIEEYTDFKKEYIKSNLIPNFETKFPF